MSYFQPSFKIFLIVLLISTSLLFSTTSFTYPSLKNGDSRSLCDTCDKEDNGQGIIRWSADRRLTINDFNIVPSSPTGGSVAASSCTGIYMDSPDGKYPLMKAYAVFVKAGSWWVKTTVDTGRVLSHEQLHFDITHYVATQLNIALENAKSYNDCQQLYAEYNAKLDSMQKLYDKETQHSLDVGSQQIWIMLMYRLLNPGK